MSVESRLKDLGFPWRQVPLDNPDHPFVAARRGGQLLYVSGQVPVREGRVVAGKVGHDLTVDDAAEAAELCAVACLYAAGAEVDTSELAGVASMQVFVNCAPGFNRTSDVADGASRLLIDLFGAAGRHSRAAIGVAELPFNAALEITMVFVLS